MPIGPYATFDICVKSIMAKKKLSKEKASAYCAFIERKINKMSDAAKWEQVSTDALTGEPI